MLQRKQVQVRAASGRREKNPPEPSQHGDHIPRGIEVRLRNDRLHPEPAVNAALLLGVIDEQTLHRL